MDLPIELVASCRGRDRLRATEAENITEPEPRRGRFLHRHIGRRVTRPSSAHVADEVHESPARAEPHDAAAWLPLPDFAELPPLEQLLIPDPTVEQTPGRDVPVGLPSPARAEPHDAAAWLPLPDLEELPSVDSLLVPDPSMAPPQLRDVPVGLPSPARAVPHDADAWLPLPDLQEQSAFTTMEDAEDPETAGAGGGRRRFRSRRSGGGGRRRFPFRRVLIAAALTVTVAGAYYGISMVLDKGADVDVRVDGRVVSTETDVDTVGELLVEQKVDLGDHDRSVPAADTPIENEMVVKVLRAESVAVNFDGVAAVVETTYHDADGFIADATAQLSPGGAIGLVDPPKRITASETPIVRTIKTGTLLVDQEALSFSSPAHTVSELLANLDVTLDDADVTSPYGRNEVLPDKVTIAVQRVRNETVTKEERYELPNVVQEDPAMDVSVPPIVTEGVPGLQAVTYQVIRHNGSVADEIPIGEPVPINPATPKITIIGTKYDPKWDKIAECETGGKWDVIKPIYQGGTGIWYGNWSAYGGKAFAKNAGNATKYQQIIVAERIRAEHGWGAWGCGKTLGYAHDDGKRQF